MLTADMLRPHQLALLQRMIIRQGALHIIIGGVGTFKSSTAMYGLIFHCMWHPGQRILVTALDSGTIQKNFLATLRNEFKPGFYLEKNPQNSGLQIHFPQFDAILYISSYQNPTPEQAYAKLHGANLSGYYFVQPDMMRDPDGEYIRKLHARIRLFGKRRDPRHIRIMDTNGPNSEHWLNKMYLDPASDKYQKQDDVDVFHVKTTPETSIYTQEDLDMMREEHDNHSWNQLINGFPSKREGFVYPDFEKCDPVHPEDVERIFVGVDPGEGEHPCGIVFIAKTKTGWVICDEGRFTNRDVDSVVRWVDARLEDWGRDAEQTVVDWSGTTWRDYFRLHSRKARNAMFPRAKRTKFFQVEEGTRLVRQFFVHGKLRVATNCVHTLKDLTNYHYGPDGYTPAKKEYDPHLLDAVRYLIIRIKDLI